MNLKGNILGYVYNLGTFLIGIGMSGVLLMNNPNKQVGVLYFLINLVVGSIVWQWSHKMNFKLSFFCTGLFYASLGICGFLAIQLANNLLYILSVYEVFSLSIPALGFISLVISLILFFPISIWVYIRIAHWIPAMYNDILKRK